MTFTSVTRSDQADRGLLVPQRRYREVLAQRCLGLLIQLVGLVGVFAAAALRSTWRRTSGWLYFDLVGTGALGVERGQEVLDRRVVHLPRAAGRCP